MQYQRKIILKDGRACTLRHATEKDREAVLDLFILTHKQTDFLLTYPDEITFTPEEEGQYLQKKADSIRESEILAEVDGKVVGTAGIEALRNVGKVRHRCDFGISIDQAYWGLGIGRALTKACIECAEQAGYQQMELEVVSENDSAVALYQSEGFVIYGRNPKGFKSRLSGWQEILLMRKEINQ